jgi:hypothetical protein
MEKYKYIRGSSKDAIEFNYGKDQLDISFIVSNMAERYYYVYPNPESFKAVMDSMPPENLTYEEVIYGHRAQRFKLDLDIKAEDLLAIENAMPPDNSKPVIKRVLDLIIEVIIEEFYNTFYEYFMKNNIYIEELQLDESDILIATSTGQDGQSIKESYHLILAPNKYLFKSNKDCQIFTRNILASLPEYLHKIIDVGVNKNLQNFRLAGNKKPGSDRIKRIISGHTWLDSIIAPVNISSLKILPELEPEGKPAEEPSKYLSDSYYDAAIAIAAPYTTNFEVRSFDNNIIKYNRIISSMCRFCDRVHDNDNTLFVNITEQGQDRKSVV